MAGVGVAVALLGFAKTFFLPLFAGTFSAPWTIHVHGAFLFGWAFFFAAQASLIDRRQVRVHRSIGWIGAGLAVGVVATTLAAGRLASQRTVAAGDVDLASRELFVIIIEMAVFAALVGGALLMRRRRDVHGRLMLLALIGSLGPAWFRFRHYFPGVENPAFVFSLLLADSLVVAAAVSDVIREQRVHWVYAVIGSGMVGVHLVEVFAFDTAWFAAAAQVAARPLL